MTLSLSSRLKDAGKYSPVRVAPDGWGTALMDCPLETLLGLRQPDADMIKTLTKCYTTDLKPDYQRHQEITSHYLSRLDLWVGKVLWPNAVAKSGIPRDKSRRVTVGAIEDFVWATQLAAKLKNTGLASELPPELRRIPITGLLPALEPLTGHFGRHRPVNELEIRAESVLKLPVVSEGMPFPSMSRLSRAFPQDPLEQVVVALFQMRNKLGGKAKQVIELYMPVTTEESSVRPPSIGFNHSLHDLGLKDSNAFAAHLKGSTPLLANANGAMLKALALDKLPVISAMKGEHAMLAVLRVKITEELNGRPFMEIVLRQSASYNVNELLSGLAAQKEARSRRRRRTATPG